MRLMLGWFAVVALLANAIARPANAAMTSPPSSMSAASSAVSGDRNAPFVRQPNAHADVAPLAALVAAVAVPTPQASPPVTAQSTAVKDELRARIASGFHRQARPLAALQRRTAAAISTPAPSCGADWCFTLLPGRSVSFTASGEDDELYGCGYPVQWDLTTTAYPGITMSYNPQIESATPTFSTVATIHANVGYAPYRYLMLVDWITTGFCMFQPYYDNPPGRFAWINVLGGEPERPCPEGRCDTPSVGRPVDLSTGELWHQQTDLALSGPFGLKFSRIYANQSISPKYVGNNWQDNYDAHLDLSQLASQNVTYLDWTGMPHYFSGVTNGSSTYNSTSGLTLTVSADGTSYTVKSFDGRIWAFNSLGDLTELDDRVGNKQAVVRDSGAGKNDRIKSVVDPLNRQLCFYYDGQNRVTGVSWLASGTCPAARPASGTVVSLTYDSGLNCSANQLCSVTEPDGHSWVYQYDSQNNLLEVDDPSGAAEEINTYYGTRVATQLTGRCASGAPPCPDTGGDLSFNYGNDGSFVVVTDGEGRQSAVTIDQNSFLMTSIQGPLCKCGGDQTRIFTYDAYGRKTSVSDDGIDGTTKHTITYTYGRDSNGQAYPGPTQVVENLDTAGSTRTTAYAYYPVGDPRQDLPQVTTLPSVDQPGSTMSVTDTYSTTGLLLQRSTTGYVNGVLTTYTRSWTYDARGRILTATGPRTDVTELTKYAYFTDTNGDHARAGQLQKITDARNHVTTYAAQAGFTSYDPFGNPQSVTDQNKVVTEFTYDALGRPLTSTLLGVAGDLQNLVTTYTYDGAGRTTSVTKPVGNGLAIGYDTSGRATTATRFGPGNVQQERLAVGYNTFDQPTSLQAQGCAIPSTGCGTWSTTWSAAYGFDAVNGNLVRITNADGTAKQFAYTAQGRLASFNDENHATGANYGYGYDLAGRQLAETRLLGSGTVLTKYTYDLHDNPTSVTDPNGNVTTYHYDDFDRVRTEISPVQGTTTYAYDPDGNLISTTDSNGVTTTYTYDALNRELKETAVKGTSTTATSFSYDSSTAGNYGIGRMAKMSDASGSTMYAYDRRGLVAVENHTISGTAYTQSYTYDANGNRNTITYPDGYIVGFGYDYADRPYSAQHQATLSAVQLQSLSRKGVPADTTVSAPEPTIPPRAAVGRPQPIGIRRGAALQSVTLRTFTPATFKAPSAFVASRSMAARPPARRRLAALAPSADVFVAATSYAPFGPVTAIAYGNGTQQNLTYSTRYFPTDNQLVSPANVVLADHGYVEDAVGNITTLSDNLDPGYSRSFAYDDLNRLTTANSGAKLWGTAAGNGYSYDPMGNLTALQLGTAHTGTFSYKPGAAGSLGLPQLASVLENGATRAITYDPFGNELSDGKSSFAYTLRELPQSDSRYVNTYKYDGFKERVYTKLKSGQIRETFYDPKLHLLAETAQFTTGTPAIAYKYVWLGDRPVAQVDSLGTHWTYADHLGTPLQQTDINAATTWQAEHEPYGSIFALRSGDVHQPLRFPGQVSEQFDTGANGLSERSYNNARWYRPNWGRYTQSDPFGIISKPTLYQYAHQRSWFKAHAHPSDADWTGNAFGYAYANPERLTDPTGLSPIPSQFQFYQHFCGPGWTNGKLINETAFAGHCGDIGGHPEINRNEKPYDSLDACCMQHDRDHCGCHDGRCAREEARCKIRADFVLYVCTVGVNPIMDHPWDPDNMARESFAQSGIEDLFGGPVEIWRWASAGR